MEYSLHINLHTEMSWLFVGDFQIKLGSEYSNIRWKSRRSGSLSILFRRLVLCAEDTDTRTIFFLAYFPGKCPFSSQLERKVRSLYLASSCNISGINPYCFWKVFLCVRKSYEKYLLCQYFTIYSSQTAKNQEFVGIDFWVNRKNT